MASPFQQIRNALARLLEGPEENPKAQLSALVDELSEQMVTLRKAVAVPLAHEKRLRLEVEECVAKISEWEQRAVLALQQNNEELAKQALLKKADLEERAHKLHQEWQKQRAEAQKLQRSMERTKQQVEEAKRKSALLLARHQSALAQKKVADITVHSAESTQEVMDQLSQRILELEAETEAHLELSGESLGDDLEATFRDLERQQKGEAALAQLKASLGVPKELAAGSPLARLEKDLGES